MKNLKRWSQPLLIVTPLALVLLVLTAHAPAWADSWAAPAPRVFASERGRFGFLALPQQNGPGAIGKASAGVLFRLDAQGQQVSVWKHSLVNLPGDVLISDVGNVVTLDNEFC